jgi:hypothetical protein
MTRNRTKANPAAISLRRASTIKGKPISLVAVPLSRVVHYRCDERSPRFGSLSHPSWWNLLVTLPWSVGLVLLVDSGISDRMIAKRQRTTQGSITAHEPANHNRYGYVFSVNGKSYTGWESPRKDELQIGKQVLVYYDPSDPAKNALAA